MTGPAQAGSPLAATDRDRMARFVPRADDRRKVGSSYSHFVRVAKFLLPLIALGLILSVVLWPRLNPKPLVDTALQVEQQVAAMVSPRFVSTDRAGRPYSIIAAQAEELRGPGDIVDLMQPEGEITMADGRWLAVMSDTARLDRDTDVLQLDGRVNLFRDDGIQFVTEQAFIHINAGTAWGDLPVVVSGPFGVVRGQGFRYVDDAGQIVFTGRSDLLLHDRGDGP